MGSWSENARQYKLNRGVDPRERRLPRSSGKDKPASRKVLLDRLEAARNGLLRAIDRRETYGMDSWWSGGLKWAEIKYEKALKNAQDFGIDVYS